MKSNMLFIVASSSVHGLRKRILVAVVFGVVEHGNGRFVLQVAR